MQQVSGRPARRRPAARYFWWLVFIGALLVAPNLIPLANIVPHYHFSWLDAFATAAISYGPAIVLLALLAALPLGWLETRGERLKAQMIGVFPRALIFILFLGAWLRLLRGLLRVYRIDILPVDYPFEIWVAPAIAAVFLAVSRTSVTNWLDRTAGRVRVAGALLVLIAGALTAYMLIEPFNQGAQAPVERTEPRADLPNIVVIVLDALTTHDMSLYGYQLPTTPNFDRLAQTWTVFDNAHAAGTATLAMQPAMLTGRYPYFDRWQRYGDLARSGQGVLSLPEILQSFGYYTVYGMSGGWSPSRYHLHTDFDQILGGGFAVHANPGNPVHTFPGRDLANRTLWNPTIAEAIISPHAGALDAAAGTLEEPMYARANQLMRTRAGTSPFFVYLHMSRPHDPFIGNEFLGTFLPREAGLATVGSQHELFMRHYEAGQQETIDRLRLRYDENILKADQQVGDLIKTLQETGLYDQSLIIITADHGNSFANGYQGYFTPLLSAAEHSIPLLLKFPNQTEGRRVRGTVSTVDIMPTILDVAGISYPQTWLDGQSLRTEQSSDRIVYVSRLQLEANVDTNTLAAIRGDLKLVRKQGGEFLYNLVDDPAEKTNLLGQIKVDELRAALDDFVQRRDFIRAGGAMTAAPTLVTTAQATQATH
jgi:arylsulfatase A-like enzyme